MRYLYLLLLLLPLLSCNVEPDTTGTQTVNVTPDTLSDERLRAPDELFGELFREVQMQQLFDDGKTFVDMVPRSSAAEIMRDYENRKGTGDFNLRAFVSGHFDPPMTPESGFVSDGNRSISEHINALWPVLTREAGSDEGSAGSLIVLPEDYIVPGGRFREVYYWDSYFTMLGLATAGRDTLVRDMVENFAYLIREIGFIPNGNRTYYLTRSQPPFFSLMVDVLAGIEGEEVYAEFLEEMQTEHAFWMDGQERTGPDNRAVNHVVWMADSTYLNRYYDAGDRPRAESYREDVMTIRESGRDSQLVARHLRSAAESGWDFSARWFADGQNLSTIITTDIVPPDLNALLYHLEVTIAEHTELIPEKEAWQRRAERRKAALDTYLFNPASNWYEDLNWTTGAFTGYHTLAGVYPLFVEAASPDQARLVARKLESDFLAPGGLRTSLRETGQQWDAPNGWPPLQWMAYAGLRNYGYDALAETIRQRWMDNNERVYENVDKMVEKYNVEDITLEAGGGEYPVQDGFGWSNGVYLRMSMPPADASTTRR
ncbi:alpha,alpha-trehalase [Lewinella marina]|uniref:Trehalase n=1 Tax=Neolewinella marina TaxID=438751 RepID=A0A2G0CIM7_9BACT|nr:alpha,alpha-trehalase TreF [Neolewinella marina]NJB85017.1 alpha,alpha-trehalase [Neolewinella marina]PHK99834.1 trehalase [Neolewinella marina]